MVLKKERLSTIVYRNVCGFLFMCVPSIKRLVLFSHQCELIVTVSIAEKENVLTSFNQLLYLLIFPKQWVQALQTLPLTTLNLPDQQNKSFRLCERLSTRYKYRDVGKCDLYYKSAVIRITLVEYLRPNVRYLPGKKIIAV